MKKISIYLIAIIIGFAITEAKKPVISYIKHNGKSLWGYKSDYSVKDWLYQPILDDAESFGVNDFAIIKMNGKFNLIDLNMNVILPEWSNEKPTIVEGFIVSKFDKEYRIYNMDGKMLYLDKKISPVYVNLFEHTAQIDNTHKNLNAKRLIGFSVSLTENGPYRLIYPDFKSYSKYTSIYPIRSEGGMLLFVDKVDSSNKPIHGIVTDGEDNIIDEMTGIPSLTEIFFPYKQHRKYIELEALFNGVVPAFLLATDDFYKTKGSAKIVGFQFIKNKSIKYNSEAGDKWNNAAYKMLNKPEVIATYKDLVITPLLKRLDNNKMLLANHKTQPSAKNVYLMKLDNEYIFTTDGKTPILNNRNRYINVESIPNTENYICRTEFGSEIIGKNGAKIIDDSSIDFERLSNGFIKGIDKDGNYRLYSATGVKVNDKTYSDIICKSAPVGDILYFVTHANRWIAWAPGHTESEPQMSPYDYVGLPDAKGVVEIIYNGYSGTYNLLSGKCNSPVKTLFNKAYNDELSFSDAKRIAIYQEVIALDKILKEGYTGASLNNIGAIYEDAGDEDTAFDYYERSKNAGNETGERNWKRIRNNRRLDRIIAVANAVEGVTSSFVSGMGGTIPNTVPTGYAQGYGDSNNDSGTGYSSSYYQNQYDNWARRAESVYNSLTNLGSRYKENGKDQRGSTHQSMSSSNYVQQKKCLRSAQNEMRSIRQKARKDGITINQSHWETVSVSY